MCKAANSYSYSYVQLLSQLPTGSMEDYQKRWPSVTSLKESCTILLLTKELVESLLRVNSFKLKER